MKYIKKYESFKTQKSELVNEEFLGKLFGGIKKLFQKGQDLINKTKGGKDIEAIYQKYLTMINDELSKTAQIDLNIMAASKGESTTVKPTDASKITSESKLELLSEAEEATTETNDTNSKLAVDTLKKKKTVMDQIVKRLKDQAIKEMDAVIAKYGGAAKNPQLKVIVNSKKDQFEMDYLNSQITYLDAAGDTTLVGEITKQRDLVSKKIEDEFKDFDNVKVIDYKEGDNVIYLLKDKKPEEYDKNKKPEDQSSIVGVHKISKIDGDTFTLEDEDGNPTITKTGSEIMGKVEAEKSEEYKVGDTVMYLLQDKTKQDFDELSDEEKKNPTTEVGGKIVGTKKIEKIDGDNITFLDKENKEFTKTMSDIMGKSEGGEKVDGQEDLVKKLGDMKTSKPDDIKKVSSYVDFISDEKNASKIEEIDKIISGE